MSIAQVKYVGATPGADANTYSLFNSVVSEFAQRGLASSDTHKVTIDLAGTAAATGTLKGYKSQDRGVNWVQTTNEAITFVANTSVQRDYLVEPLMDFKLEWVNGGSAQTTWLVDVALTDQRAAF